MTSKDDPYYKLSSSYYTSGDADRDYQLHEANERVRRKKEELFGPSPSGYGHLYASLESVINDETSSKGFQPHGDIKLSQMDFDKLIGIFQEYLKSATETDIPVDPGKKMALKNLIQEIIPQN